MAEPVFRITDLEGYEYLSGNPIATNTLWEEPDWLADSVTQVIDLVSGWNLISTYIDAEESYNQSIGSFASGHSIVDLFDPIVDKVIIVKNSMGSAYLPEYNFNGIGNVSNGQGYQVKVTEACSITLVGLPLTSDGGANLGMTIDLVQGWNLVGVPISTNGSYSYDVAAIYEPLTDIDQLIIVKDNFGSAYMPQWNFNGIGPLVSGQGYQLKVTEACSIEITTGTLVAVTPH